MKVKEVMKRVKTIDSDSSVKKAAKIMSDARIGSLVVLDGTKVVGIITERDILSKVSATNKLPSKVKVSDIMTSKLIFIHPEDLIDDAVYLMLKYKIKKLPVMEGKELLGILTSTDIVANSDEVGQFYFFG